MAADKNKIRTTTLESQSTLRGKKWMLMILGYILGFIFLQVLKY
jgi:hypothetical protein